MINRTMISKLTTGIVLVSIAVGCTTMRLLPATDAQSIASQLQIGDEVIIVRSDAADAKFEIDTISDEGIGGDGVFVRYSDIQNVQIRERSTAKTVGLVSAILIVVAGMVEFVDERHSGAPAVY